MPTLVLIGSESIDADAVVREEYSWPAEATAHPVERGAALGDHVRPGSLTVELELLVTDTPIRTPSFGAGGATLQDGSLVVAFDRPIRRASRVVDRFRRAQVLAELASIQSVRRGLVENMAITEIREPYETARGIVIGVRMVQIRIASARTVAIPETLQDRGKRRRDRGKQPAQAKTETQRESAARKLARYAGVIDD